MTENPFDAESKMDSIVLDGIFLPAIHKYKEKTRWFTSKGKTDAGEVIEQTLERAEDWKVLQRGFEYMLVAESGSELVTASVDIFSQQVKVIRMDEKGDFISSFRIPEISQRERTDYTVQVYTMQDGALTMEECRGRNSAYL